MEFSVRFWRVLILGLQFRFQLRIYCVSRHIFSIINFLTFSQRITGSSASLDIKWDFHHIFEFIIKEKPYFSSD